jgi:selenocysteine-specific elongation factor
MAIIGTAGHVDHGKSTLVRALTGIDPDRLAEEKRRGMTIDLGFAHLDLPSGERVGIVDVPGHARFLHNMLAGVHGMDVVLLVVAADEGVMPQTREHLDICQLVGVERMVVALTKVDLVEPSWLAVVEADVRAELGRRGIDAEIVRVAAPTGQGIEDLTVALSRAVSAASPPDSGRPRLPVDRAFTIGGFGTVVTGSLVDGRLRLGQELELVPPKRGTGGRQQAARPVRARVRGLQQHGRQVEEARPGSRVAVNLQGVDRDQVHRGQVLAPPRAMPTTTRLDARLQVLPASSGLRHNQRLRLHTGTVQVAARLLLLEGDELAAGAQGWGQLRLAEPVALRVGDRIVLRRLSPAETIAGGLVVDLEPVRHRRGQAEVAQSLERRLESRGRLLEELRRAPGGVDSETMRGLADGSEHGSEVESLVAAGLAVSVGPRIFSAETWSELEARAVAAVVVYLRRHPLRLGASRESLRQALGLEGQAMSAAIQAMLQRGALEVRGTELVTTSGWEPVLAAAQQKVVAAVMARLEEDPLSPPRLPELAKLGLDDGLSQYLVDSALVVRVAPDLLMLASAVESAREALTRHLQAQGSTTVAVARDVLGSSRRTVVPLLEYFDASHLTRRDGDLRFLRETGRPGAEP